jgi:hypothetical protein
VSDFPDPLHDAILPRIETNRPTQAAVTLEPNDFLADGAGVNAIVSKRLGN